MPIVHIHILEGRTLEQKRKLVKSMTEAVVNSLGVDPDAVTILIHEIRREDLAKAGVLYTDK